MSNAACKLPPSAQALFERRSTDSSEAEGYFRAIEEVMAEAAQARSAPHFQTVLRHRGPDLRDTMMRLSENRLPDEEETRPSLLSRLHRLGMSGDRLEWLAHAERTIERAHAVGHLLEHRSHVRAPHRHEHEAEQANWMFVFATIFLHRAAAGYSSIEDPSAGFAVELAVESARDAYAHWATALELCSHDGAA